MLVAGLIALLLGAVGALNSTTQLPYQNVNITATAAPSLSSSPSASATALLPPSPLSSYTQTASPRASILVWTYTSTPTSSPAAAPAPAAPTPLTREQQLGLGFGIPIAIISVTGIFFGFFARQTAFKILYWVRIHALRQAPKEKAPQRAAARLPADPGIIQLNLNPAMVQQQTAMDLLHLARQQRLEAIQAQQQLVVTDNPAELSRIKSFKQIYKPMRAPGTSV